MALIDLTSDSQERAKARLQEAGDLIEELWRKTISRSGNQAALPLAEASQAIHRALIALSEYDLEIETSSSYVVDWE